jgi:hypothetical protein
MNKAGGIKHPEFIICMWSLLYTQIAILAVSHTYLNSRNKKFDIKGTVAFKYNAV